MKHSFSADAAWEAFGRQDFALAAELWERLIDQESDEARRNRYRFNYTYVLLAQGRFDAAQALLEELYQFSQHPLYLHQMGYVARESGDLNQAHLCLEAERARLGAGDHAARAANAYELGLVALLQNNLPAAHNHARDSLTQARRAGDRIAEGTAHRLLGDVMMAIQKANDAQLHYRSALRAYAVEPFE